MGPKGMAVLVIALTFLVGGLAGAVADRAVLRPAWSAAHRPAGGEPRSGSRRDREGRERGRERFVQQLTRELNLRPDQVARIDAITRTREQKMSAIWAEVRPRIRTLIDETRSEIDRVLTPEQLAKLKELRRQREARERADTTGPRADTGAHGAPAEKR